jgi:phage terminase small subunit
MAKKTLNKLNDAHYKFIDEYISNGFIASNAYAKAYGASPNTSRSVASVLLDDPLIKAEIELRKAELRERANIKKEDIVNTLLQLIEQCKTDKDKNHMIKALDMLNKMNGLYQNNLDITSGGEKISINIDLGL